MPSKIDDWSRLLGNIESKLEGLTGKVDENRRVADERHEENKDNLERIDGKLDTLTMDATQDRAVTAQHIAAATLDRASVRKELDGINADVGELKQFRGKVGAWIAIAVALLSGAGWLLWHGVIWIAGLIDFKAFFGRLFH